MSDSAKLHKRFASAAFNTVNTAVSLLKIIAKSRKAPRLPNASNTKCIVLGNGPSLRSTIDGAPGHFKGCSFIAVNGFALSDDFLALKPQYYVLLDPGVWKAEQTWIDTMLQAIVDKTHWPLHLMIPREAQGSRRVQMLHANAHINVHYLNYVVYKGWNGPGYFFWKKNLAMPQCQNVLVAALFIAINLGYKEIELAGADHNWHESLAVDDHNVVCLKQVHFYDNGNEITYQPFYKTAATHETFRMDEAFHAWARVFHGYWKMRDYANFRGSHITNISSSSFVDAFERKKLF